jgi:diadenosine tetraphosphate (Ap4A) HIT family hydrolase
MNNCIFCSSPPRGQRILYANDLYRVILVDDQYYVGYLQVILNEHIKELTDLSQENALKLFAGVLTLEQTIRQVYSPDKINIASLGNVVPHVHFHIIPRFKTDRHFPNPIWGKVTHPDYLPSQELQQRTKQLIEQKYFL